MKAELADDKYLQPVLEDDALLYNLDDLVDPESGNETAIQEHDLAPETPDKAQQIVQLRDELHQLQSQFRDYVLVVQKSLDAGLMSSEAAADSALVNGAQNKSSEPEEREDDSHYFQSYSYNGMLG